MPFEVIPEAELRLLILGVFYRVAQVRDRRGQDKAVQGVDHKTGLPKSAEDLLSRSHCPFGKQLAMELVVRPEEIADSHGQRAGTDKKLKYIPRDQWTAVELEWVQDLSLQIKCLVHKLTEQEGFFNLTPPGGNPYDPEEPLAFGEDGMTRAFRITWAGLKAAFAEVPGTKYDELRSLRADVGEQIWSKAPDWAKEDSE